MNRIQVGVIATAIFLAVVIIFGLTRQTYDKHDLLGVIPGMTHTQAMSVGKARKWGCQDQPAAREFVCATGRGKFSMEYLSGGDQKVARATLRLSDAKGSAQSLADDISGQYRKKPVSVEGQEPAMTFTWALDDGLTLQMRKTADAADISITNDALQMQRDSEKQGAAK
jgi:hypothetical protein